jgi:hypothetical protein
MFCIAAPKLKHALIRLYWSGKQSDLRQSTFAESKDFAGGLSKHNQLGHAMQSAIESIMRQSMGCEDLFKDHQRSSPNLSLAATQAPLQLNPEDFNCQGILQPDMTTHLKLPIPTRVEPSFFKPYSLYMPALLKIWLQPSLDKALILRLVGTNGWPCFVTQTTLFPMRSLRRTRSCLRHYLPVLSRVRLQWFWV